MSNNGKKQSQPKMIDRRREERACVSKTGRFWRIVLRGSTSAPARCSWRCHQTDTHPVQVFNTFTEDLHRLADWLVAWSYDGSHGIYWRILDSAHDILEERGLKPCLVNALTHGRMCQDGAPIGMNVSGCNICTRWGCCEARFDRKPISVRCES